MSKFDSALAEAAYIIAGHGFTEHTVGDLSEGNGPWQATVRVSRQVLMNLGENADECFPQNTLVTDCEFYVWIMEDEAGFVTTEAMCNVDYMPDQVMVMDRDFEAVAAHYVE